MPGVDTCNDEAEIEYIQENMPDTTIFKILNLEPEV